MYIKSSLTFLRSTLDELVIAILFWVAFLLWQRHKGQACIKEELVGVWRTDAWDRAPFGVALVDWDSGKWIRVNPEVERITGYSSHELCSGMTFQDVVSEAWLDDNRKEVDRVKSGEQSRYTMYLSYRPKPVDLSLIHI